MPKLLLHLLAPVAASLLLMVEIILASPSNVVPIPESEVQALLQFKAGITGFNISNPQALRLEAWNVSNAHSICESWVGVTCTDNGHHVAAINLTGYGLVGSLPPHLGNLTFLSTLNLSDNHLTGSIPPQLSGCTSLQALDLNSNALTGLIASSIGSLSALQVLDLCHNHLTGPIPSLLFTNLSSLLKLNLCANSLTGSIPAQAGGWQLASLQLLNLWENNLTGPIPRSFNSCTNLRTLDLHSNELTGMIPSELSPNLHWLNLGQNNLIGSIASSLSKYCNHTGQHAEGFSSLTLLVLSENNLIGSIPPSLGGCQKLVRLFLNSNKLTGSIPPELGLLKEVQWIKLDVNNLTGQIPSSLGDCSSLKDLSLFSNQLDGPIPAQLGALPHLLYLHLYENYLSGPIPSAIANCSNLTILQLPFNQLAGPIPNEFGLLQSLSMLIVWGNRLTGSIPASLGNCSQLVYLDLGNNKLSSRIPTEMLTHLQKLILSQNNLSGFRHFGSRNFTSLIELEVANNNLVGTVPSELGQLQSLQLLDMSSNVLSGEIPWQSLINCSSLYTLDLSNNYLNGSIFTSTLGGLRRLQYLSLQRNFLHGSLPNFESSAQLSLLQVDLSFNLLGGTVSETLAYVLWPVQHLDLSNNAFSGALPSWLGVLTRSQMIDLSKNNYSGSMPESLSDCTELIYLNLSHNSLSGGFPLYLGSTPNLQSLDLSSNNLTGPLPSYVEHLHNLQFLDVSFNGFTGTIPVLGVFKHLNASSFLGNPGLCGPIIRKTCNYPPHNHHHHHHGKWKREVLCISLLVALLAVLPLLFFCRRLRNGLLIKESLHECFEAKHYSAEELILATQGYSDRNLIGEGALGVVYRANLSNGEVVAVKKFKEDCSREALLQEVQILSKLRHRNLVRILGCVLNLEVAALVLEFMSNGSVEQLLHPANTDEPCSLSWDRFMKILIGVANALGYMHHEYDVPVIHGDIKPTNILLDDDFEPHVADFGLAKLVKAGTAVSLSSDFKGSIGYMAPEYALAAQITTKADVFSFGVVVLEMLTGRRPTDPELHGVSLHEWVKGKLRCTGAEYTCAAGSQEIVHSSSIMMQSASSSAVAEILSPDASIEGSGAFIAWLLRMAVSCTEDHPAHRPTMQQVLRFLRRNPNFGAPADRPSMEPQQWSMDI